MSAARPSTASLVEVVDRILNKGVVVDLWARLSVAGIETITVEVRLTGGSVETFLHYARAVTELDIAE